MSWLDARQKIQEGTDYTDTVEVPFGDETIELTHRLLTESELYEVEASIDREELMEYQQEDMSDAEQRIRELQEKDDLTAAEQQELKDLARQIQAEQAGIMDSMGEEAFDAFMNAGRTALTPSEEDIDEHFELSTDEQERRFNFVPNTREEMREAIELEMREMVVDQPYPIKLIVGQKAYAESVSLLGDAELDEGNPT
ncbi:hypothetical protein PN419_00310 [Halorubrum ezzemoulense]|uniref:hypothetical protein n=1 Tax=Halorubrum ezzemoulense TaxID=337243 RepID=UPI00232B708B|nr:hypothetical protein [Halorubrum ezzemoulense]MDB9247449.1 hypothetical protein [Halorubrum ezzemoulense]MDB9258642.1 hypothetical protein [Halorubrum ezzemoulense]MDB9264500.1 hypothetical protein [Halorubrum ezzemoulense]MDB9269003.1 hypothetical protein [Halorubrum ezzemoulense]MDB9271468.1 hypothetical protein [Halorubrum ezzemoulense]